MYCAPQCCLAHRAGQPSGAAYQPRAAARPRIESTLGLVAGDERPRRPRLHHCACAYKVDRMEAGAGRTQRGLGTEKRGADTSRPGNGRAWERGGSRHNRPGNVAAHFPASNHARPRMTRVPACIRSVSPYSRVTFPANSVVQQEKNGVFAAFWSSTSEVRE